MKKINKIIPLISICWFFAFTSYAQDNDKLVAYGKLKIEWGENENAKITLYRDGTKVDNLFTKNHGKFEFILELNHMYMFWFEKAGYVTKKVEFNTKVPDKITKDPEFEPFPDFDFNVTLFKIYPNVDTMFFEKPVGKIQYNASLNDFDYDKDYNLEILKQMEEIEKQIKEKHEEAEKQKSENAMAENKKSDVKVPFKETEENANPLSETETSNPLPNVENNDSVKASNKSNPEKEIDKIKNTESIQANLNKNKGSDSDVLKTETPKVDITQPKNQTPENVDIQGKLVTKTSITQGNITLMFIKVEYTWGGRFFFIQDEVNQYRNISETYYNLMMIKK